VILLLPHSSRTIPDDIRRARLLDAEALEAELLRMTDAFAEELFSLPSAMGALHSVSRLVVGRERFPEVATGRWRRPWRSFAGTKESTSSVRSCGRA